ncbi:uncharacterized protein JCM6883_003521 [Sporobolomyces salmoneus]|uniref:uncharacterized protein n=1 Tax=Sporobolomyces salmoneus TaxID=183962 RepID=UPI0031763AB9
MTDKLSSLPPELLRDTIEATVPHTYHSTTYKQRQRTLYSLCLVSKTFRAIAQPLLCEIVQVEADDELEFLLEDERETLGWKEIVLGNNLDVKLVEELLRRSEYLESVIAERFVEARERDEWEIEPVDLGVLVRPSNLKHLRLYGEGFKLPDFFRFTSLRSLCLDDSALISIGGQLLDPELLPSLRALGLDYFFGSGMSSLEICDFSRILPQLDAIYIPDFIYLCAKDTFLSGYSPRILVDFDHCAIREPGHIQSLASVHHFRIDARTICPLTHLPEVTSSISTSRASKSLCLKSIYLDDSWHPSQIEPESAELLEVVQQLMEECVRAGIEVVFEEQQEKEEDSFISKEFCSRQRRRREKESSDLS